MWIWTSLQLNIFCLLVELPKAPLTANATVVKTTVVQISWQRSPDDFKNDSLTYAVDCFKCESSRDKNCKESCNPGVEYSPSKENISGVEVTINGLPPSSYLLFRVYSLNELNQLEPNRDDWNFAKVFVKTRGMKLKLCVITNRVQMVCRNLTNLAEADKSSNYLQNLSQVKTRQTGQNWLN